MPFGTRVRVLGCAAHIDGSGQALSLIIAWLSPTDFAAARRSSLAADSICRHGGAGVSGSPAAGSWPRGSGGRSLTGVLPHPSPPASGLLQFLGRACRAGGDER
jgi:hypothetical protein